MLSDLNILMYFVCKAALYGRFYCYPILQIRKLKCWVNKLLKVAQILDLGFELGSMGWSRVCSSNMALYCLSLSVSNR